MLDSVRFQREPDRRNVVTDLQAGTYISPGRTNPVIDISKMGFIHLLIKHFFTNMSGVTRVEEYETALPLWGDGDVARSSNVAHAAVSHTITVANHGR